MELIREIIIPSPPTKYTIKYKKPKYDKDGKLITHVDYYLTGNLFTNTAISYHIISKIVIECKRYIYEYLHKACIPELELMSLETTIRRTKDIDLDNSGYFWRKLCMDILKTPTSKQVINAKNKGRDIITTRTIPDDNTKYVRRYVEEFEYGEHALIFRIYGRVKSTQQEMYLFFK